MKDYAKHQGFTLIELMIVVVVIAILAMMMMMSSDEASVSARAAAIISDFENIKAAAAAYYLDHRREIETKGWPGFDPDTSAEDLKDLATNTLWTYLDEHAETKKRLPGGKDDDGNYTVKSDGNYQYSIGGEYGSHWFVWCKVPDKRVMDKLKARKASLGLCAPVLQGDYHRHSTASMDLNDSTTKYIGMCIH